MTDSQRVTWKAFAIFAMFYHNWGKCYFIVIHFSYFEGKKNKFCICSHQFFCSEKGEASLLQNILFSCTFLGKSFFAHQPYLKNLFYLKSSIFCTEEPSQLRVKEVQVIKVASCFVLKLTDSSKVTTVPFRSWIIIETMFKQEIPPSELELHRPKNYFHSLG